MFKSFVTIAFIILFFPLKSFAYVEVKISDVNFNPIPIISFNFLSDEKSTKIASLVNNVVNSDLQNSGMFYVFPAEAEKSLNYTTDLLETSNILSRYMDFNVMLIAKVRYQGDIYKLEYILWDIYNAKPVIAFGYNIINFSEDEIYNMAHEISNSIYKTLVGELGYFNSKITFVSNQKVYVMDYDGRNKTVIASSENKIFTPVFSDDGAYLAYIVLNKGVSEIYLYIFSQKKSIKLGNFNHLVLAPRFSPNNKYMLFAVSKNGSTNIVRLDLETRTIKQLTYSFSINIPGNYSPDSNHIVFSSDREGSPQIYEMDADGTNIKRITNTEKGVAYYDPKWSPRGDLISFTKIKKGGKFYIGVMNIDGTNEKILADDWNAEGANWANNGINLIYQFEYDRAQNNFAFYILSLAKGYKYLVKPFSNAIDPSFSNNFTLPKVEKNKYSLY